MGEVIPFPRKKEVTTAITGQRSHGSDNEPHHQGAQPVLARTAPAPAAQGTVFEKLSLIETVQLYRLFRHNGQSVWVGSGL